MSVVREFREFALKGNVIDLAVGVIIGAAFARLVDSVVADLVMPLVSLATGRLDFSNWFLVLGAVPPGVASTLDALKKAGVPVFAYGQFITVTVNFLILAAVIFVVVRQINRLKRQQAEPAIAAPVEAPEDVRLLREIRDSLRPAAPARAAPSQAQPQEA